MNKSLFAILYCISCFSKNMSPSWINCTHINKENLQNATILLLQQSMQVSYFIRKRFKNIQFCLPFDAFLIDVGCRTLICT